MMMQGVIEVSVTIMLGFRIYFIRVGLYVSNLF